MYSVLLGSNGDEGIEANGFGPDNPDGNWLCIAKVPWFFGNFLLRPCCLGAPLGLAYGLVSGIICRFGYCILDRLGYFDVYDDCACEPIGGVGVMVSDFGRSLGMSILDFWDLGLTLVIEIFGMSENICEDRSECCGVWFILYPETDG